MVNVGSENQQKNAAKIFTLDYELQLAKFELDPFSLDLVFQPAGQTTTNNKNLIKSHISLPYLNLALAKLSKITCGVFQNNMGT